MKLTLCAPCLFGLEGPLGNELRHMDMENVAPENGRVYFTGDESAVARANIRSRFAERVLIVLGRFPARTFDELFEGVRALPWEAFIPADGAFPVKGYSLDSQLHSVPDCQSIVKKAAVERAFAESDEVLVEECIRGREMGCGVLIAGGREYLLPITEIRPKKEFFDFQAKYEAGYSDEITPAEIAPQTAAELHRLALAAYKACRCRGIVRVDFIVTPEGRPYLIEINTIPGMSAGSIVPKQVRAAGMTLGELYDLIIADTCGRKP